jgi:type IV pilus assembly protein PilV
MKNATHTRPKEQGFTLIEVLIALVIISIGALGYTRAQFSSLQTASDSALRITGTLLIDDMVARIEANAGEALQGLTSGYQTGPATLNNNCLSSTGSICAGNQMALHDLADWNNLMTTAFPVTSGAVGIVCLDVNPGNTNAACTPPGSNPNPLVFTVKILWSSWKNRGTGILDQSIVATVTPPLQR